jgi:hypothetical protein
MVGGGVLALMYAVNSEQAVKMRDLAQRLRRDLRETQDSYYRRMMLLAALDLEGAAENLERAGWKPEPRLH